MTDDEYCEVCGKHEDDCDCEEYCDNCDKPIDDCECEEESTTLEDVDKILDTANKGLDFLNKLKKQSEPPQPKITPENVIAHLEVGRMAEEYKRKEKARKEETKIEKRSDAKIAKRHNETIKWTKIGIVVGTIVAIILGTVAIIFN